jgi:hypothetical protein
LKPATIFSRNANRQTGKFTPAPRGDGALHGLVEGIVAAGVQNDEPQLLGGLDHRQNSIQRNRFIESIDVALKIGIERD